MPALRLPGIHAQGFWRSFHASCLASWANGLLCGSTRLLSRRTLALIQIWASEAEPLLSSVVRSLSHDSRPSPDGAGLPRLRERRAFWQVGTSIAQRFKPCKWFSACGQRAFHPLVETQGLSSPVLCKEAQRARERGQKALQQLSAEKVLNERCLTLPGSVVQKLLEIKRVYGVYAAWDASEACMRMIGKEIVIKL